MASLSVAPWIFTTRAWVWWSCYAVLVFVTYRLSENVISIWTNYLAGIGGPFLTWSTEIKFMVVYGAIEALFLVAQIIVLPFYRNLSVRLRNQMIQCPANAAV